MRRSATLARSAATRSALAGSALATVALLIAACGERGADTPTQSADRTALPATSGSSAPSASRDPAPAGEPAAAPQAELTPEAARGETGARDVLLDFARDIERGRYAEARAMLSDADRSKWSERQFAALFADLRDLTVAVPTGTLEGAAGSLYYTAPVSVTGTDRDGRPIRLEGEAVLRRVNDVDGASAAQRRWHFQSLGLDWTH